jgi:hypothetical protein
MRESSTNTVSIVNLNTAVKIDITTEIMIGACSVSSAFNYRDIQFLEKRQNTLKPLKTRKMRLA